MKAVDKFNRSAVSNDPAKLDAVDRRTKVGRRLRDLTASITAKLTVDGKPLDDDVGAWVKLAAANMLRAEQIAASIGRGETIDDTDMVRMTNSANRTMKELRDMVAQRSAAKPFSIADHIAANPFTPPVEPEDEDDGGFEPVPGWDDDPIEPEAVVDYTVKHTVSAVIEPEPIVEPVAAPKPVAVYYSSAPRSPIDPQGVTLHQVAGLLAAQGVERVRFTTSYSDHPALAVDRLVAEAGAVLAAKNAWFFQ